MQTIKLKWNKNRFGRWQSYYKGRILEIKHDCSFLVNGSPTENATLRTVLNFIDDGFYQ